MAGLQPTLAQLRPALQLALETATAAGGPLPGRVRNLVRNRRLPANWAATMRQVIEEDEAFRASVAAAAAEETLGRLAWLWLTRPEGWPEQLNELVQAAFEADEREKGLRRAEERITELEGELARVRAEALAASSMQADLVAEVEDRRRAAVASLEGRLQKSRAELQRSAAELMAARERADALQADNERLGRDIRHLRSRLSEMAAARARAEAAAARSEAQAAELAGRYRQLEEEAGRTRLSVGQAVGRAADAARQLGDALAEAAGALGTAAGPGGPTGPSSAGPAPPRTEAGEGTVRSPARVRGRPAVALRRPLQLPPAVFEDSPEAASYLVRAPGVHLVVDGYNVTFTSWTGDDLPALRHRLVTALSELAVRVQRAVTVVFDGTDDGGRVAPPPVARPWLRIVFSASTVEADEVIVDAVRQLAPEVPVVVATDDRQVRADAGRWGANVLSVEQLLGVLGRQPAGGR